jgi:transposase
MHSNVEAEKFYRDLKLKGVAVRVGMEATGHAGWFYRLLADLGQELWVGEAAQIKATRVRKQKTDRRGAEHILKLILENRFPRVWVSAKKELSRLETITRSVWLFPPAGVHGCRFEW